MLAMPDSPPASEAPPVGRAGIAVCRSEALAERGRAVGFDLLEHGRPVRAFVLRVDGQVQAYLNRCLHVPMEMDWQQNEFWDGQRRWIVCATHGAAYDPQHGRCVGGPCGRGHLTRVDVAEQDGQVCWYPSRDLTPVSQA